MAQAIIGDEESPGSRLETGIVIKINNPYVATVVIERKKNAGSYAEITRLKGGGSWYYVDLLPQTSDEYTYRTFLVTPTNSSSYSNEVTAGPIAFTSDYSTRVISTDSAYLSTIEGAGLATTATSTTTTTKLVTGTARVTSTTNPIIYGNGTHFSSSGQVYIGKVGLSELRFNPVGGDITLHRPYIMRMVELAVPTLYATGSVRAGQLSVGNFTYFSGSANQQNPDYGKERISLHPIGGLSYHSGSTLIAGFKPYAIRTAPSGTLVTSDKLYRRSFVSIATVQSYWGSGEYNIGSTTGPFALSGSLPAIDDTYYITLAWLMDISGSLTASDDFSGTELAVDIYYKLAGENSYKLYTENYILGRTDTLNPQTVSGSIQFPLTAPSAGFSVNKQTIGYEGIDVEMVSKARILANEVYRVGNARLLCTASFGYNGTTKHPDSSASASWTYASASGANSKVFYRDGLYLRGRETGSVYEPHIHFVPLPSSVNPTGSTAGDLWFDGTTNRFMMGLGQGVVAEIPISATGSVESASYALTSSYASKAQTLIGSVTSASYALTASYAANGGAGLSNTGSFTGSFKGIFTGSSIHLLGDGNAEVLSTIGTNGTSSRTFSVSRAGVLQWYEETNPKPQTSQIRLYYTANGLILTGSLLTLDDANLNLNNGDLTVTGSLGVLSGSAYVARRVFGNSGTTFTINWSGSNSQRVTLSANSTASFASPSSGGVYVLEVLQNGTGNFALKWPTTVLWATGSDGSVTATANRKDVFTFYYTGLNYLGQVFGRNFADTA